MLAASISRYCAPEGVGVEKAGSWSKKLCRCAVMVADVGIEQGISSPPLLSCNLCSVAKTRRC